MKNSMLIGIIMMLFLHPLTAQFDGCNCNDIFDLNVRTTYSSFDRQETKSNLYKYLSSSVTKRQEMKSGNSLDLTTKAIINQLPLDIGFSSNENESSNIFISVYKEAILNQHISDDQLYMLSTSFIPEAINENYNNCLKACPKYDYFNKAGVTLSNVSQSNGTVLLQLKFKSVPAGGKITIDNATYSSGSIIGQQQFHSGREILDGQIIFEQIRLNKSDDLIVSISFKDGGLPEPAVINILQEEALFQNRAMPIGSIVASVLPFTQFLEINGIAPTSDMTKMIWVPCDGRKIGTETGSYGAFTGGTVPDLRGVFLRGINDMGVAGANIPVLNPNQKNPENTAIGKFQNDAFQGHRHHMEHNGGAPGLHDSSQGSGTPARGALTNYENRRVFKILDPIADNKENGTPRISSETRPKNITVYYYLKIR